MVQALLSELLQICTQLDENTMPKSQLLNKIHDVSYALSHIFLDDEKFYATNNLRNPP